LRKERFSSRRKNKLIARSAGPFTVIENLGNNVYKLQLPGDMAVSATFNVGNLSPYVEDALDDPLNLRSNPLEEVSLMPEQVPWSPKLSIMLRKIKRIKHWPIRFKPFSPSLAPK